MAARVALAMLALAHLALVAGQGVTDQYVPYCSAYSDPPPSGWLRWSQASTWPGGAVPGVGGNAGASAVIPCGVGVLLDTNATLGTLDVRGSLKVEAPGPFQVFANFIVNQGRIDIGSPTAPYAGKVMFNITGSSGEYIIQRHPTRPTDPAPVPRSLGTRAVITLGGRWNVNGMYGNQPGWTTLASTAAKGATSISVKGNVGAWPVGGEIAISSTDYDYTQAERVRITSKTQSGSTTVLGLARPLQWSHWGGSVSTGLANVTMDQAAEVLLLTRSVVIQGHPNPQDPLIGAHFIINQTPAVQSIIGVELVNMGQQGKLARYPMHFHLCQDVAGSEVRQSVVHDSNQRCYVVHGTWNARLIGNGAFQTKGHCFVIEDGIENGNQLISNLGFSTEPPRRPIDISGQAFPPLATDSAPATFWITNANNTFLNNVAAGSFDSGYWFEVPDRVAGPSSLFPGASKVYPKHIAVFRFEGNSAHSNGRAGLRTYPSGWRPKVGGGVSNDQATAGPNAPPQTMYFKSFRAYKNDFIGMFIHETDSLVMENMMVADNGLVGVELNRAQGITIRHSIFLGETENTGNPTSCGIRQSGCRPLMTPENPDAWRLGGANCVLPRVNDPALARAYNPELLTNGDLFGILVDSDDFPSHGGRLLDGVPHRFLNLTFGKFYTYCRNAAAGITANGAPSAFWSAAYSASQIRSVDNSAPIWMVRPREGHLGFEPSGYDGGPMSYFYTLRDQDGSIVGGQGGYVVTANSGSAILPARSACTEKPRWNAFSCPGACYRTVYIQAANYTITRVSDGRSVSSQGSLFVNLPSNTVYRVRFTGTAPRAFTVQYMDRDEGCADPVVLQFVMPSAFSQWTVPPAADVTWQACQGVTTPFDFVTQTQNLCSSNGTALLQVTMGAKAQSALRIQQTAGAAPPCGFQQCGILRPQSLWSYNDSGVRPASFLSAVVNGAEWRNGRAMFGLGGIGENTTIANPSPGMVTTYFRRRFQLKYAGCMDTLLFNYVADDGIVVYINGAEAFRTNLPAGRITAATKALVDVSALASWTSTAVSADRVQLKSGNNWVMVELHLARERALEARFDMSMAATGQNCPTTDFFNPSSMASVLRNK